FMQEPHELHWKVAKWILHYVHGTYTDGIHYHGGVDIELIGFTDFDWAGDLDHQKSTSGYILSPGLGPISWSTKKQNAIVISSTEAEYRGV
ncbi:hypothetical protein KI387_008616, partial [Taxus chinensis]